MQFSLDTEHCEGMKLTITDKERQDGTATVIQEFCFGMASLFVDFAMKLNCRDAKQADKLKEVCFSCIGHNIDEMVKQGLLKLKDNEIDEDEINDLVEQLKKANFSEDQIAHILEIVRSAGSIEAATDYLQSVVEKTLEELNKASDESGGKNDTISNITKDESNGSSTEDISLSKGTKDGIDCEGEVDKENGVISEKNSGGFDYDISGSGITLTISGTGAIPEHKEPWDYIWNRYPYCKRVVVAEGITELPCGALMFSEAESVKLPDSLTTIKGGAFEGMRALKRLRLGKNITNIDSGFFYDGSTDYDGDAAFSEIIVSEDNPVYKSEDGILYSKDMKTLVRFPVGKKVKNGTYVVKNGVETIADYAFSLTGKGLKEVKLPSTVKAVGMWAFEMSFIEKIDLSSTKISEIPGYAFTSCYELKSIKLPSSLKVIKCHAFYYSGIEEIVIPEGVERIEEEAFINSSLRKISLPSTIIFIGKYAFSDITNEYGYELDELSVAGNLTKGFDHKIIEEEGNYLLLNALDDVPDIKGTIHLWEVKFCYGTGADFTEWVNFNISCSEEEFNTLKTLSSKQKKPAIDKVEALWELIERIEDKIEKLIRDKNDEDYADWILNDDGIIRYIVKGFAESGM